MTGFDVMNWIAMGAPGGQGEGPGGGFLLGWVAIMIGIFYVMIIRPQKRRENERKDLLKAVKSGDKVLFSGGMIGVIANVKEKTFVIKIADKTKIEVLRGAVTSVLSKDDLPADLDQELPDAGK